jgi:thiol-disulfide isomerase/thioredoxin
MKKLLISLLVVTTLFLVGCKKEENKEGLAFKESYEKLNGKTNKSGKEHRTVHINEDNPFVLTTPEEIVKMIENKETFYLYVGDPLCPWCRSAIEKATEIATKKNVKKVYSIEIWDDEGNEILRDKYEMVDGKLKKTIEGKECMRLLAV